MIRALRYFIIIAILAGVAAWLADQPGFVTLQWGGYRIDTSFGVLAIAVGSIAVLAALFYRTWLFIRRAPESVRFAWRARRRTQGYQALTKGMVAVAAGDADEARRLARRAEGLLSEPPLTMLLSAQAAQLSGDERAAERFFRAMTENRETEFLGLRGLLTQAMKQDDTSAAIALARRAHRLKPDSDWVSQSLFELQTRTGQWLDASVTVKEATRNRHLSGPGGRRQQAVLACQLSSDAARHGDDNEALKQARAAIDLDPDLTPAVLAVVRSYVTSGKLRKAGALIERAWGRNPHPEMATLYTQVRDARDPLARVKAAERLAGFNPGHVESDLAVAHAALQADLWGQTRKHLMASGAEIPEQAPARTCRMMAELEEAEHNDLSKARQWLVRASTADPDPAWVCGDCGNTVSAWSATCGNCHGFDRFEWRTPPHAAQLSEGPAAEDARLVGVSDTSVLITHDVVQTSDDAESHPAEPKPPMPAEG